MKGDCFGAAFKVGRCSEKYVCACVGTMDVQLALMVWVTAVNEFAEYWKAVNVVFCQNEDPGP